MSDEKKGEADTEGLIEEITFHVQEVRRRSGRDAHELLGVHAQATVSEIHDAYRYLAQLLHPDRHPEGTPKGVSREAADLFREISAAYHELGSPRKPEPVVEPRRPQAPPFGRGLSASAESLDGGDETRQLFYKAGRFYPKARDMFQQALLYDKCHKMARQELKAVTPLIDPGGPKPLWKKIFGK